MVQTRKDFKKTMRQNEQNKGIHCVKIYSVGEHYQIKDSQEKWMWIESVYYRMQTIS